MAIFCYIVSYKRIYDIITQRYFVHERKKFQSRHFELKENIQDYWIQVLLDSFFWLLFLVYYLPFDPNFTQFYTLGLKQEDQLAYSLVSYQYSSYII